jgi:CRP-like cAMP-binding protein/ATP/ADP translocase
MPGFQLKTTSNFTVLYLLLLFIFGGAIVGETVALSMIVAVAGPSVMSKSYIINGVLLFGLPLFFFGNIDRFRREQMLSAQLLSTMALLVFCLLVLNLQGSTPSRGVTLLMSVIYPLSYLSKTILFLTFWTLANDVCDPAEAKREFPTIAAWGLLGGLCGALVAQGLLRILDVKAIVGLWILLYLAAFLIVRKVAAKYRSRLLQFEKAPLLKVPLPTLVRDVLEIRLVRVIAVLYYLVFLSIFSLDFLFWKQCHVWFPSSNGLASFQFSFYMVHAVATILCLWLVVPRLIAQWGFAKILFVLPATLLVGAALLLTGNLLHASSARPFMAAVVVLQFSRQVVFENAFSPIYQMFFIAIPKERRGRAKTFLDGIVKPGAILSAGMYLTACEGSAVIALSVIVCAAAGMIYFVTVIRRSYVEELVPRSAVSDSSEDLVTEIGSKADLKILSLIDDYAGSSDPDFRQLAVRILAFQGSRQSFQKLVGVYDLEKNPRIREMIARSLVKFRWDWDEVKDFIGVLLKDENPRIRANVVYSLNEMNCSWKGQFVGSIEPMLFDSSLRAQIEAARFVWYAAGEFERSTIRALLKSLLSSPSPNRRSAGLYLVGVLKPENWEETLLESLSSTSLQVFTKSIDTILRHASQPTQIKALSQVEKLSRQHIAVAGLAAQSIGEDVVGPLLHFLTVAQNRRMIFEVVHSLRVLKYSRSRGERQIEIGPEAERIISQWITRELETVYKDAVVWQRCRVDLFEDSPRSGALLLDDALRDRLFRIAEWALDAMVLLDKDGLVAWGRRDLDLQEHGQRLDMVEILENLSGHRLAPLIVPILRCESWDEVGRTARSAFKLADDNVRDGPEYFVQSENRWVSLCALFCICQQRGVGTVLADHRAVVERLAEDGYAYLAKAAASLLATGGNGALQDVETFNLLETALFLKQTPMFRTVPAETLIGLAEICELKQYSKGTVVSREGYVSDVLFVVGSGSLEIVKVHNNVTSLLAVVGKGETYGEIGLFSQSPRSASAIAREDCALYEIQRSSLKKLLVNIPEMAYSFLELFSEKLRKSGEEITVLRGKLTDEHAAANVQTTTSF